MKQTNRIIHIQTKTEKQTKTTHTHNIHKRLRNMNLIWNNISVFIPGLGKRNPQLTSLPYCTAAAVKTEGRSQNNGKVRLGV